MDSVRQDICFAYRTLRRDLGFAFFSILILGLGIGVATAVFGVVNAVLLKPLPYPEPSRLVAVTTVFRSKTGNRIRDTVALHDIRSWREHSRLIESMGGFLFTRLPVRVGEAAYLPNTAMIDPSLLRTLRVTPTIGTDFPEDSRKAENTVIISHAFWQRAFGGAPDIVGKPIHVSGSLRTVRGVLPADFEVPRTDARLYRGRVDLLLPAVPDSGGPFWGIARLKPGVSIAQAQAELHTIDVAMSGDHRVVRLSSLAAERTRASRHPLEMFLALGAVLLLIACTNLMNLLMSRNTARAQEMAVRHAIGANRGRLLRQMLTESLCLATLGGAAGLLFATVAMHFIEVVLPVRLPIVGGVTLDLRVLGFGFAVAVLSALVMSFVPALLLVARVGSASKGSATGATARSFPRTQKGLTIAQIGLCVGLLAAAGVLAHSLYRLDTVDRGFDSKHVLGFELNVPGPRRGWKPFVTRALEQIRTIPGVRKVGYVTFLPPETWAGFFAPFRFDSPVPAQSHARMFANTMSTSPDYFETVGMSIVEGRRFGAGDVGDAPSVMIVNRAFVRRYLPDRNPIGRRVFSAFDTILHTHIGARRIVGVVNDTRDRGMAKQPVPTIFLPYRQGILPYGAIALRTRLPASAVFSEIRRRLGAINPDVPLVDFQPLSERIHDSLKEPRFYAFLAGLCAAMAVLFVSVGLYGVISYSVSRRTVELGVRMALGSSPGRILRLVLRQGVAMASIGAGFGLVLAYVATRGLQSLLFNVDAIDPPTLVASVLLIVGVALAAAYVPARRACRLSTMQALRYE